MKISLLSSLCLLLAVGLAGDVWSQGASPSGGATIPATTNLLKGNGVGGVVAATPGTDYAAVTGAYIKTVAIRQFTSAGTYIPTAGMAFVIVECVGNGGGGGGTAGSPTGNSAGGGGGGGSYSRVRLTAAQIGVSKGVTFGAAGTGAPAGTNTGTAGGDVALDVLCVGKGGAGGGAGVAGASGAGGAGGLQGTGDIVGLGVAGDEAIGGSITTFATYTPKGGSGFFGGGQAAIQTCITASIGGSSATGPGSGGYGGCSNGSGVNAAGGNGATGIVVLTEFITQ